MSDDPAGAVHRSPANPDYPGDPTIWDPGVEQLEEAECLRLIPPGGIGTTQYWRKQNVSVAASSQNVIKFNDVGNLMLYQAAVTQYAKRDEQVRTLGNLVTKLVG